MKNKFKDKKIIISILLMVVVLVFGITYAWKMLTTSSDTLNKIKSGDFIPGISCITDEDCGILMEKMVPMSYRQGLTTKAYKFKLTNEGNVGAEYTIRIKDFYDDVTVPAEGKLADEKIRYIILKDDETPTASNSKLLSDGRAIETGKIDAGSEIEYTLYMWIDSRAGIEVNGQIFSGKIEVTFDQETPSYTVSGVLTDDEDQISPNSTLAAFKKNNELETVITDSNGKFSINDLPQGVITIYYIPDGVNPKGMSAEELSTTSGVATTTITSPTDRETAILTNLYKINYTAVKKIGNLNEELSDTIPPEINFKFLGTSGQSDWENYEVTCSDEGGSGVVESVIERSLTGQPGSLHGTASSAGECASFQCSDNAGNLSEKVKVCRQTLFINWIRDSSTVYSDKRDSYESVDQAKEEHGSNTIRFVTAVIDGGATIGSRLYNVPDSVFEEYTNSIKIAGETYTHMGWSTTQGEISSKLYSNPITYMGSILNRGINASSRSFGHQYACYGRNGVVEFCTT